MATKQVVKYRHGRFVVSRYKFVIGGEGDTLILDFVKDHAQGFGVPAKSFYIENHGEGSGNNYIYFRTTMDGNNWDKTYTLAADTSQTYTPDDGCIFTSIHIWSSNANCTFSLVATPGIWTPVEYKTFLAQPTYDVKKERTFSLDNVVI